MPGAYGYWGLNLVRKGWISPDRQNDLEDHTNQPKFIGTLAISNVTDDAAFTNNFASMIAEIDWTTESIGSAYFDSFVYETAGTTTSTAISSGCA